MPSKSNFQMARLRRLCGSGIVGPARRISRMMVYRSLFLASPGGASGAWDGFCSDESQFLSLLLDFVRNNGFLGTMILAPRAGCSIIDGIPNRDDRWREKFFVSKINAASVGDFNINRIPREWSDEIEPFGSAPMTPELRGLIATLHRGNPRWLEFTVERIRATYSLPPGKNRATPIGLAAPIRPGRGRRNKRSRKFCLTALMRPLRSGRRKPRQGPVLRSRSQAQSPGLVVRPVVIAVPVDGARTTPNNSTGSVGDRPRDDDVDSSIHQNRRRVAMEASNEYVALMEKQLADFPSKEVIGGHLLTIQQLWGELEAARVKEQQREAEVEELKGKLAAAEVEKVAIQSDLDSVKEKHRRELKGRGAAARNECHLARCSLTREYEAILAAVKTNEGDYELEEELERLKCQEVSLDVDYGLASVSDPSLSRLGLPQISGDSSNQD
ncbi:hypothetical protein DY000_02048801 [Brassica cretica]|uniref:Uncharacterized protein n=1 Tax=Brassica cretica TaxID=69181 RepID=A0ABQ7EZG9_BRACR|nr:hypothetical protein DY000_02048801 [Brassica cretica]